VASKWKALAEQTAKATGEIGQRVSGIQAATQESWCDSGNQRHHREIVGNLSTIAAAVEEQGAATREISAT
jgi:methyl-accepting chemotaxis protein